MSIGPLAWVNWEVVWPGNQSGVDRQLRAVAGDFPVLPVEGLVAVPDNPHRGRDSEDCSYPVKGSGVATSVITKNT